MTKIYSSLLCVIIFFAFLMTGNIRTDAGQTQGNEITDCQCENWDSSEYFVHNEEFTLFENNKDISRTVEIHVKRTSKLDYIICQFYFKFKDESNKRCIGKYIEDFKDLKPCIISKAKFMESIWYEKKGKPQVYEALCQDAFYDGKK